MRRGGVATAVLLLTLGGVASAQAVREQEGDVLVSFDGGISPKALPRTGTAPVAVTLDSSFKSAEGLDPPPQLKTISIGINRRGKIFDRGLPTCSVRTIQPATMRAARQLCGGAIVGRGHVHVRVHLSNQQPFTFKAPMLVFNAKRTSGERRLLAQVYGSKPPSAFVLNFRISREPGDFGTVIKTSLPQSASKWAYVTHFDMTLQRIYTYRNREHSYVSAGCAAPPGFPGAVYAFAQASFGFAEGEQVTTTLIRDCTVKK